MQKYMYNKRNLTNTYSSNNNADNYNNENDDSYNKKLDITQNPWSFWTVIQTATNIPYKNFIKVPS